MAVSFHHHYTWNSQMSEIWKIASELKENESQVDVYLQGHHNRNWNDTSLTHQQNIPLSAHRLMLAAASPFLNKVLCDHYAEHHDPSVCILIPNVSQETLRYIVDFIYSGNVSIPLSAQKEVLEAAKLLQILNLINIIELQIKEFNEKFRFDVVESHEEEMNIPLHPKWKRKKHLQLNPKVDNSSFVQIDGIEYKEKATTLASENEGHPFKRHCRRIKSRYDSDTYEVSLPKMRHFEVSARKEERSDMPPKNLISKRKDYMVSSSKPDDLLTSSNNDFLGGEDNRDGQGFVKIIEFPQSESKDDLTMKTAHHDPLKSNVPLTLQSPSSLSIGSTDVISNLFTTESSYLQGTNEIPCSSFLNSTVSASSISKKFDPPPLTAGNFAVPQLSELQVSSVPFNQVPLGNSSLKYIPTLCRSQEISQHPNDDEDDDETEEEDGLFKLQVLLKDCEDFPETVTHHISNTMRNQNDGVEVKLEEPSGGLDIRQWISEEVRSPEMPKEIIDEPVDSEVCTVDKEDDTKAVIFNKSLPEKDSHDDVEKNFHECHDCGKTYSDIQSLKVHAKNFHKEAKQMCKHCGKMFKRRSDLYDHERRHSEANLPCKMCGKTFKLKKDLDAHVRTHGGGKRYTCNQCGKELTSYRNLKNHIAGVHEKQRSYSCHMCNKSYAKSRALQVHIRSVHTGERPFKCEVCGKTFCNPCLLKAHEVSHTGEQKYSCKVCHRRFSQYSNMVTHQRVHSNERPFVCTICKEGYKTRESLRKHKWIHTGLKPLRCPHCSKEYRIKESFERHMLKCHDEVVHLPQIYFEMSKKVALESIDKDSGTRNIRISRSINDSTIKNVPNIKQDDDTTLEMQDHEPLGATPLTEGIVPVVQFVNEITQGGSATIQLETSGSGQLHLNSEAVQIDYPILSANNSEVEDDGTLANITGDIATGSELASPIESLLQVALPATISNSSVLMTQDGKVNILLDC